MTIQTQFSGLHFYSGKPEAVAAIKKKIEGEPKIQRVLTYSHDGIYGISVNNEADKLVLETAQLENNVEVSHL
jgi:hypothetical protein